MNSAPWSARLPRMSPARAFGTVFGAVFLFIFLGGALVTFMLSETYKASARVIAPGIADLQLFHSAELLRQVSQQLHLPEKYAARYGQEKTLTAERVEELLRRSVQARRIARTDVIEIRVYDRSATDCAQLANEIAEAAVRQTPKIRILERAVPPLKPSRPNKPLNLALGAAVGVFLGTMAGGVGAKLAVGFGIDVAAEPSGR